MNIYSENMREHNSQPVDSNWEIIQKVVFHIGRDESNETYVEPNGQEVLVQPTLILLKKIRQVLLLLNFIC